MMGFHAQGDERSNLFIHTGLDIILTEAAVVDLPRFRFAETVWLGLQRLQHRLNLPLVVGEGHEDVDARHDLRFCIGQFDLVLGL